MNAVNAILILKLKIILFLNTSSQRVLGQIFSLGKDASEIDLQVFQGATSFIEATFEHKNIPALNCKIASKGDGDVFKINDNRGKFFGGCGDS